MPFARDFSSINSQWSRSFGAGLMALGLLDLANFVSSSAEAEESCLTACPTGAPASNIEIYREAYTLSNNGERKFADWLAYRVDEQNFQKGRPRNWKADPDLPPDQTLEPADYKGAYKALKTDRGHQAPLFSLAGLESWKTTNYLSNIRPQSSKLNQSPWLKLETAVREVARKFGAVHVVTGPLYEKEMAPLPGADEDHTVPSGYFKLVARTKGEEVQAVAFIALQDAERKDPFCDGIVPISQAEQRSGLTLLPAHPNLENAPELQADLGC